MFNFIRSCKKLFVSIFATLLVPGSMMFSVMGSVNYKIQSDSINFGGGLSSSTNYKSESTFGELSTGNSSSASYNLSAGYLASKSSYIAITSSGNVTLPSISGLIGGIATSSSAWLVTTDDPAGYSLSVQASASPALQASSSAFFSDYAPVGADPDYTFSILSSNSAFGFSPEGTDIIPKYKDNGSLCNAGVLDTSYKCWTGFSTSSAIISQTSTSNQPNGATTTLQYQAQIGSAKIQDGGAYSATITVTALPL